MHYIAKLAVTAIASALLLSCERNERQSAELPPIKIGAFYDIEFGSKVDGLRQSSFRVVAVGPGSWVQVETYDDPNSVFAMTLGMGLMESKRSVEDTEKTRKKALDEVRKMTAEKWLNLDSAISIAPTDLDKLGFLRSIGKN